MNYGQFLKRIKTYCINKHITNEDIVNEPIEAIVKKARIKKKKGDFKGELFFYEATAASRIINNKLELPTEIRDALKYDGMEDIIINSFHDFYEDEIDKNLVVDLIDDFLTSVKSDPAFKKNEISEISKLSNTPSLFLSKILIKSLKEPNLIENANDSTIWSNGNNYIKVIKGDIFTYALGKRSKKKRIVVIPVNNAFDVHVTTQLENDPTPLISTNTLHGELLIRIKKSNIDEDEIAKRIRENLRINKIINGNEPKLDLPIGTIASLDFGSSTIYMLAISKFSAKNKAQSSKKDILIAISKLLEYYDDKGQGYDLYIPLMGTGMSRAYLSYQESYDIIKNTLLNNHNKLQGKINIIILPEVIDEIEI